MYILDANSLLEPDYQKAYSDWRNTQSPSARAAMIQQLMPVIEKSVAGSGGDVTNPVFMAKAKLLALSGLPKYDPHKAALNSYMYSHMRGLHRVLGTENNIIKVPESIVLDKKRMGSAEVELTDELGRFPSTREIADKTGLSLKRIEKLRSAHVPVTEAQVETAMNMGGVPAVKRLGDTSKNDAWMEYVYDSVGDRQKSVMERMYGMHGFKAKPVKDVAKDLKISPAAVSQHRKQIDNMLNSELEEVAFG